MRWVVLPLGCLLVVASMAEAQDAPVVVGSRIRVRTGQVVAIPGVVEMRGARTLAQRPIRRMSERAVTLELESTQLVNVIRPGYRIVGMIAGAAADRIELRTESGQVLVIPKTAIERVEVPGEVRPGTTRAGMGFGVGATIGALVGLVGDLQCRGDCTSWGFLSAFWGGIAGGAGAIVGALASGETWRRVPAATLPWPAPSPQTSDSSSLSTVMVGAGVVSDQ
jgi:hypothetical protein